MTSRWSQKNSQRHQPFLEVSQHAVQKAEFSACLHQVLPNLEGLRLHPWHSNRTRSKTTETLRSMDETKLMKI